MTIGFRIPTPEQTAEWARRYKIHKQCNDSVKNFIVKKFKGICQVCGVQGVFKKIGPYLRVYHPTKTTLYGKPMPIEIHHILAVKHGGTSDVSNLTLVCRSCFFKAGRELVSFLIKE